jgi:uncharacterized metal-binding protein YceD (DUF177 family)
MKIELRKITPHEAPFKVDHEGVLIEGVFKKTSSTIVEIDANLTGTLALQCNRCGIDIEKHIEEPLHLKVSDGCFKGDDLDVYECHDGFIHFDEIALSEIETIKYDYHYCDKCDEM